MQTDMFRDDDMQLLVEKFDKVEKAAINVRKGLFARHGALEKRFCELEDRFKEQEMEIYKLKQALYGQEKHEIIPIDFIQKIS